MVRIIAAFVVAKAGASLTDEALDRWCAGRLADYKRPRRFIHMSALPRTASGKVLRRDLRDFTG
ncbi:MAG: AMP-dependent synthetase, partial [Hyphomicrobiales bacterium]|nr:AMP-dependent synthetase [Hyphomicrobiales bacterium]